MNNELLKSIVFTNSGKVNPWASKESWWRKYHPKHIDLFFDTINTKEKILDTADNHTFSGLIFHSLNTQTFCHCGKPNPFYKSLGNFSLSCSNKCGASCKTTLEKRAKTISKRSRKKQSEINNKSKKTKLERYGNENYNNINKNKLTCIERYGVDNVAKSEVIKERISKALKGVSTEAIKGTKHFTWENYSEKAKEILISKSLLKENLKRVPGYILAKELNVSAAVISKYSIKYGIEIIRKSSFQEKEIVFWLESVLPKGTQIITNTRRILPSGKELDIYIPKYKLAIEYNGLFWHSTNGTRRSVNDLRNYHLKKTNECEAKGFQLLHIFENEWLNFPEKWKSVMLAKLGLLPHRIFARKLTFREITSKKEYRDFERTNHLQSTCFSSSSYGLYDGNRLVSVASFSKSRFSKSDGVELVRFCSLLNTSVVGGFSKMIKNVPFLNIISYANRRWSTGNVYETCNFSVSHISSPNYFYFKGTSDSDTAVLFSRNKFQKHKLSKLLDDFDNSESEYTNMFNNGYRMIFDCGNIVLNFNKSVA